MISFIVSAKKENSYPLSPGEVVFVGRSNVGKSSLINALYGNIAYVGKTPGKTRLLNFFDIDGRYTICDVPGYGYADISDRETIEFGEMMEEYFNKRDALKLCVMILDIRRTPNEDDLDMQEYLDYHGIPCLFVLNKADKLSGNEMKKQLRIIADTLNADEKDFIVTSCLKKTGIGELKKKIEETVCDYDQKSSDSI